MTDTPQLATLIESTEAVRSAIADGRWEDATQLETDRRAQLQQFVAGCREMSETLRQELARINGMTQAIMGEVHHHQRRLEREVFTLQKGKRAARIYADINQP